MEKNREESSTKNPRQSKKPIVKSLKLDVGCGGHFCGDVNIDLYVEDPSHNRVTKFHKLDTKQIPNFIQCDAQYLPFQNEVFTEAYSTHVIEHVPKPALMLRELIRVSSSIVTVECPHRYGETLQIWGREYSRKWMRKHHINHLYPGWFQQEATKLGWYAESTPTRMMGFPHNAFRFMVLPFFIRVTLRKESERPFIEENEKY